jgi:hypothetical protein
MSNDYFEIGKLYSLDSYGHSGGLRLSPEGSEISHFIHNNQVMMLIKYFNDQGEAIFLIEDKLYRIDLYATDVRKL